MKLFNNDCLEQLKLLEENSVDSLVTDPPAGISFMGKDWDHDKGGRDNWIAWMTEVMTEAKRVMKPGAHGLVWALPRTSHWTATALENAGFEIRDVVTHLFGTGFPKSFNLGNGYGTALKPASEHWILVRKPCSEKTVAANVLKWGTGGINIDGCRIPGKFESGWSKSGSKASDNLAMSGANYDREPKPDNPQGRFPANLVLDEVAAEMLDEQTKDWCFNKLNKAGTSTRPTKRGVVTGSSKSDDLEVFQGHDKPGANGASRFFYVSKASKTERNAGLEDMPKVSQGAYGKFAGDGRCKQTEHQPTQNHHPTVKSSKLMEYLIKLVTPEKGIVLDPFMGSGSTGVAALKSGFEFIGIEQNKEYFEIASKRIDKQ